MIATAHSDILTSIFNWFDRGTAALARLVCKRWSSLIPAYSDKDGPVYCDEYVHNHKLLLWARFQGCPWTYNTFMHAVKVASVETLDYLFQAKCQYVEWTFRYVEDYENPIPTLEWLLSHNIKGNGIGYEYAAKTGNLDLMKWLYAHGFELPEYISDDGHEYIVLYIIKSNFPFIQKKMMLEWYNSVSPIHCPWAMNDAAEAGNIDLFQYIFDAFCSSSYTERDFSPCYYAAKGGSLDMLQYLRSKGFPWDEDICNVAAQKGHFSIVKWALQNGCPFSGYVYADVIKSKSSNTLEMMNWLYDRGYPIDRKLDHDRSPAHLMVKYAIESSYPQSKQILDWLLQRKCSWHFELDISKISLETLQYIHAKGYPLDSTMYRVAAERDNLPIVEWLYSQGVLLTDEIFNGAALSRSMTILKWARARGCSYPNNYMFFYNLSQRMRRWVIADGCPSRVSVN